MHGAAAERPALSSLNKAGLMIELAKYGAEFHSKETVTELRAKLSQIYRDQPLQSEVPRGFSRMKHSELQELCMEKTTSDTRGQLMTKIRQYETERSAAEPALATDSDTICFGKHSGSTYMEVYQKDRGYCTWVQATAQQEPFCAAPLRRFAGWLDNQAGPVPLATPTRAPAKPTAGPANSSGPRPWPPQSETKGAKETSAASSGGENKATGKGSASTPAPPRPAARRSTRTGRARPRTRRMPTAECRGG